MLRVLWGVLGGWAFSYERGIPVLRNVRALSAFKSVTSAVGTPLCPYGIAYRRAYGLSTSGLFKTPFLLCWVS